MTALEKLFANLPRLPSIPKVVHELIASLAKDDVDIGSLVAQVKQDQSISARVLKIANSSAYGASKKIGSIDEAVIMIGLAALRSVVIASGMSRAFNTVAGVDMRVFWRHALVTAGVGRLLGKREGVNAEFAYTAGLMHRVGQLVIHLAYPAASKQLSRAGAPSGVDMLKIERSLTDTDHCEVGAELAKQWNFPADIQNALANYVTPLEGNANLLAAVVALASHIASGLEAGLGAEEIADSLDPKVLARCSMERTDAVWRIESCLDLPAATDQLLAGS